MFEMSRQRFQMEMQKRQQPKPDDDDFSNFAGLVLVFGLSLTLIHEGIVAVMNYAAQLFHVVEHWVDWAISLFQ